MKTKLLSLIILLIFSLNYINAQGTDSFAVKSGIYMTFADFLANKFNLEVNFTKEKNRMRTHDFAKNHYFEVIHRGKKYHFLKNEVYGIRDNKGKDFRFFNEKKYQIADTGAIYLYTIIEIIPGNGKPWTKYVTNYCFSVKGDEEIIPLTLINLKKTFPENYKLHNLIDDQFKSDASLTVFDKIHKTFKINYLISEVKK
jgi:hypothetical protein